MQIDKSYKKCYFLYMISYLVIFYVLALVLSFYFLNVVVGLGVLVLEVISFFAIPFFINKQKRNIKNAIEQNNFMEPILNINKAPWYLFAQLPNITTLEAKKMVHLRKKYGKYKSLDDFFRVNLISNEKREQIEKYLYV